MKYLIIHADDGGVNGSVNDAIIDGLKDNYFSSTSVLVPAPESISMMARLSSLRDIDVGVHLCVTGEHDNSRWKPLLPAEQVPTLVDKNGYLWSTKEQFAQNASLAEIERELKAQIEMVFQSGLKPTHIDSHQGTMFLTKELIMLYLKLGKVYDLLPMILKPSQILDDFIQRRNLRLTSDDVLEIKKMGIISLDSLHMVDLRIDDYIERKKRYETILTNLTEGVSQIIVHPGYDDNRLRMITKSSKARQLDFTIFREFVIDDILGRFNIKLVNWHNLKEQDI